MYQKSSHLKTAGNLKSFELKDIATHQRLYIVSTVCILSMKDETIHLSLSKQNFWA